MMVRHIILPLHMDTNSNDGRIWLSGETPMPVPIHRDESDTDSNVSSEDPPSYTDLLSVQSAGSGAADEVKLEIRNVIRTRREARGLDGMPSIEAKKPKIEVLSFEEEEKRRIRRERNKLAAFKCRQRRKEHVQLLQEESDALSSERSELEREIAALKAQKEQLEKMVKEHDCVLKESETTESNEAKSPQPCSSEVAKTTSTGPVDSVKA